MKNRYFWIVVLLIGLSILPLRYIYFGIEGGSEKDLRACSLSFGSLCNKEEAIAFYKDEYKLLEDRPVEGKRKILEVIKELELPLKGEVLDFGCGNGHITEVIREALPGWKVYGMDLNKQVVRYANKRHPNCTFFEPGNSDFSSKKFDLVFSHHVIEHFYDLNEAFNQMTEYLKPKANMLHFLPCGNEGSFEYDICVLRKDGIDPDLGNRFFFEEETHLRRLTTDDLCKLCLTKDYLLDKEFYFSHYYGSVEYLTSNSPLYMLSFFDVSQAVNEEAKRRLRMLQVKFFIINMLRYPAQIVSKVVDKNKRSELSMKHYVASLIGLPFYPFSEMVNSYYKRQAREEADQRRYDRGGAEMVLYFKPKE